MIYFLVLYCAPITLRGQLINNGSTEGRARDKLECWQPSAYSVSRQLSDGMNYRTDFYALKLA